MVLTDTHTHLYSSAFEDDRDKLIEDAFAKGISRFFLPAIDAETTQDMYSLEASYPENVFVMMGLHPTSVKPDSYKNELEHVESELQKRKFVAIGEIGIDLYWDKSTLAIQKEAFHYQIRLAKQYKLPIVIHCREAFDEIFEVLEEHKGDDLFGIFHCFTGTLEQAKRAIALHMKLGIGGVVTFKNGKIDQFLDQIDLSHVVLETDGPYLAPAPFRGKRNEPAYLHYIAKKVSDIYQVPIEKVATITTENSKAVFGL